MTNDVAKEQHKRNTVGILSAFVLHPSLRFEAQEPDEEVVLFLRADLLSNIPWLIIVVLFLLLPPFLSLALSFFAIQVSLPPEYNLVFLLFYYLFVFCYAFIQFLHWCYNMFLITSKRIIDIDYSHTVYHNIATTRLENVEDVTYTQSGFFASLFNTGSVYVITASDMKNFEALHVPHPKKAADIISKLAGKEVKSGH